MFDLIYFEYRVNVLRVKKKIQINQSIEINFGNKHEFVANVLNE